MKKVALVSALALSLGFTQVAFAACSHVTNLSNAITNAASGTGGYGLPMWVTIVDETGKVCSVSTSGTSGSAAGNSEWLGSRIISAQKANTANAFSINGYAISTANLYSAVQPGGSLFGLQESNPIDASRVYLGSPENYGKGNKDPLVGQRVGGLNVFGGGLALYKDGVKVGAVGVSGDTSCRDHAFAWKVRSGLGLGTHTVGITTANVNASNVGQTPLTGALVGDELIISNEAASGNYWNAWSHPACPDTVTGTDVGVLTIPVAP